MWLVLHDKYSRHISPKWIRRQRPMEPWLPGPAKYYPSKISCSKISFPAVAAWLSAVFFFFRKGGWNPASTWAMCSVTVWQTTDDTDRSSKDLHRWIQIAVTPGIEKLTLWCLRVRQSTSLSMPISIWREWKLDLPSSPCWLWLPSYSQSWLLVRPDSAASRLCADYGGWIRISFFQSCCFGAVETQEMPQDNLLEDTLSAAAAQLPAGVRMPQTVDDKDWSSKYL